MLNKDYFKIIQITDTHLFKDNNSKLFGLSCNDNFDSVINHIKFNELNDTDAIFLTGDLSQDETSESYEFISNTLKNFKKPIYWIPGNHDSILLMEEIFHERNNFYRLNKLSTYDWEFIFVNSKIDGRESGYISNAELNKLKDKLSISPQKKSVIIVHHHPIEVNTPLVDDYILENRKEFWNIITNYNVKLVICGHVHNDYSLKYNGINIESAPATCLQWQKGATEFSIEKKIGYKVYYFGKNSYEAKTKIWSI